MAALSEGRSLEKRQTQSGDRFFLFGQVMRSLGEYKSTTMVLYSPIGRIIEIMYHYSVHEIYQHFIKVREMILTNLERICFFSSAFQHCSGWGRKIHFETSKIFHFYTSVEDEVMILSQLQVEVGEPVVQTVGNISNVIATSPFGNTVQRTVEGII